MQDFSADHTSHEAGTIHRTLVLPGIQDTREDWEPLRELLHGKMELVFAKMPQFTKSNEAWRETKIQAYERAAEEEDCTMLMGHSWGTHLSMEMLLRSQKFEGSILLNPARNELRSSCETLNYLRSRKPDSFTELLMWVQARDMDDETFFPFADRHEKNYATNKAQIRKEFELVRTGPRFNDLYDSNTSLPPTLVVRAPCDLSHISEIPTHGNMDFEIMNDTYHYPHVSKPHELAGIIQTWINQKISPPKPVRVLSDAA